MNFLRKGYLLFGDALAGVSFFATGVFFPNSASSMSSISCRNTTDVNAAWDILDLFCKKYIHTENKANIFLRYRLKLEQKNSRSGYNSGRIIVGKQLISWQVLQFFIIMFYELWLSQES